MVIKLDGLSEKEKKAQLEFAFLYPKSFELIKQEGRVEGAESLCDELKKEFEDRIIMRSDLFNFIEKYLESKKQGAIEELKEIQKIIDDKNNDEIDRDCKIQNLVYKRLSELEENNE